MPRQRPIHSAQRAINDITLGVAKATRRRQERIAELGLREEDQQYQIAVSGTAGNALGVGSLSVVFDFPFHFAPGQRDSDLEVPHMTFGAECDALVQLGAFVLGWLQDSGTGAFVGANLAVSCIAPTAGVDFTGKLHVTFQGFSGPDDSSDVDIDLEQ